MPWWLYLLIAIGLLGLYVWIPVKAARALKISGQQSVSTSVSITESQPQVMRVQVREEDCPVTDDLCAVEQEGDLVLYGCGHRYASRFAMNTFGYIQRPSEQYWVDLPHCGDCLTAEFERCVKRCAHCKRAIMPGDSVALFPVGTRELPDRVFVLDDENGRQVMQCTRYSCSMLAGALFSGNWTGSEVRPVDWMTGAALAAITGHVVVGSGGRIRILGSGD